jgi:hypothetical protein
VAGRLHKIAATGAFALEMQKLLREAAENQFLRNDHR